ncbi:ABC transporter permease [Mucilaginibacter terrae]|uniref:ABC transport system permease protein n=1 Tax=Mucilaginibacter terrae TaxID=1955052 RepID=A0ABU3GZF2_9SPHI|nr:ABC transporter permease [Mucilaginibacter terrae]MDT3405153.1 putative ABC transport system permease protein [Mucilaginibacter terrae]
MYKNYFKTALRNLLKHKIFSLINIIGLAIGISAALVIYLIVSYDFGFNKLQNDDEHIYRVVSNFSYQGQPSYNSGVPVPLGLAVKTEVTGLDVVAPFYGYGYEGKITVDSAKGTPKVIKKQEHIIVTDGSYFDLLNYKWLAGSRAQAFASPNQVVLTAKQASLYFPHLGYANIMGRQVIYEDTLRTTVAGIVEDLKVKSDFAFHDFISLKTADTHKGMLQDYTNPNWGSTSSSNQLLIKVRPDASLDAVKKQLNALYIKYRDKKDQTPGYTHEFGLQPLNDIHFNSRYDAFDGRQANKTVLYSLLGVAAFLLILGCINFINLTTAQSVQRAKEIGVRKTIGGTRKQLIGQFLTETFVLTVIATLLSALIAYYLLQLFGNFIPKDITYSMLFTREVYIFITVLILVITLASGLYPAMVLSSFIPVQVLKGYDVNGKNRGSTLRKTLTVTQFIIAQFFIMATLMVGSQIHYALSKDLGFSKDAILYINTPFKYSGTHKKELLAQKIAAITHVKQTAIGGPAPSASGSWSTHLKYVDGKKEIETEVFIKNGDEHYMNVYKLRLLAGRTLEARDSATKAFVINETYAHVLGFKNPKDAVGKMLDNESKVPIIGVVKDFYQTSLHTPIKPVAIITNRRSNYYNVHVALQPKSGKSWSEAIAQMQSAWKEIFPEEEFSYTFVDESVAKFYKAEQDTSKLLNWATGLSILISCMGLLGLAIHSTNQRVKEIGVRKVLGASVSQIVTLLSADFVKLIIIAFAIALPIAWYAMHQWLQRFAYHTQISWWIFAGAITSTLFIALLSMSMQTVKAALANPVKSLRSE